MTKPSNRVHDKFRERNAGLIDIPTNSKRAFDQFHVSRERLGSHEEYDATVPNDWGGTGKYVEKPNDIRRNAIGAMGDICAKSSFKQPGKEEDTGAGPRCVPHLPNPYSKNPMYKKRPGE